MAAGVAAAGVTGRADRQECWAHGQDCVGKRKGGRGNSRGLHKDILAHHSVSSNKREGGIKANMASGIADGWLGG